MAKKTFTDESLSTFVNEVKKYTDEAIVQSDWNQTDETASDYIANKPEFTADDATQILIELNIIDPVVDTDGSVFIDKNGNIFSL